MTVVLNTFFVIILIIVIVAVWIMFRCLSIQTQHQRLCYIISPLPVHDLRLGYIQTLISTVALTLILTQP